MGKTIVVSNRLPVKVKRTGDEFTFAQSEGGLATGLGAVYQHDDNIWIGWPGLEITEASDQERISTQLIEKNLLPVFLSQEEINQYYEGFSNEILWPVFHYYASTYANYTQSNWSFYKLVNEKFRDAILAVIEPGDRLWIHDYQLLLLPALVRAVLPDISIGFFQHIPFPSFELFRLIPWRTELLEGMLGADLIGFHTFEDARHFLSASTRLLPYQSSANVINLADRSVVVESFPMGIDSEKFASLSLDQTVIEGIKTLKNHFSGLRIILSVDRLDYSKGILQRLAAFEMLLEMLPEYLGKIILYMIVVPSRDNVLQYKELHDNIDKKVGNINARFSSMTWSPIHYFYRSVELEDLSILYQAADICLVTPMRDGMNLVSKEYIASRSQNTGVLILSEMAGASKELIDALIVNPSNIYELYKTIDLGLKMGFDEQSRRMKAMKLVVFKFTVGHWVKIFMEKLSEVKEMQESQKARRLTQLNEQIITHQYVNASKRLLLLDYDGTLVGFQSDIEMASPDHELYRLLKSLQADTRNTVVIISGRQHETLEKWFGHTRLNLIAEHGAWSKDDREDWQVISGLNDSWKPEIMPILETYTDRTPGSFIEEKTYSLVWHYRKAESDLGEMRANELVSNLRYLSADKGLQLLPGNKVVEIKNIEINKGKAALTLIERENYDFIVAIGDDQTDEDIFKILPAGSVSIKVGSNISNADYFLRTHLEVRILLGALVKNDLEQVSLNY